MSSDCLNERSVDTSTITGRMRLLTGDYFENEYFLEDDVYLHLYALAGNNELEGAIEALESIINNIALAPKEWRSGDVWEKGQDIKQLERRLIALKVRKRGVRVPIVMKSDRRGWGDFEKAFGKSDY